VPVTLAGAIRSFFEPCAIDDPATRGAVDHLLSTSARYTQEPSARPAVNPAAARYLAPALEAGRRGPAAALAAAIAAARDELHWYYGYAPLPGQEDLADRIAFCEILGPKAGLRNGGTRLGFTLIGPATHYPAHAHPAVELYYVIAGTARWSTPSVSAARPPGSFILHRASEPHAMETAAEPLLALYSWSGDIDSPSLYVKL